VKAIVQDRYGSPDVLELRDVEKPGIGDGEVLVRVYAAGVDPGVWHLMTGLPYLVRVMGYGLRAPKARVCGMDVAGRVEAVGRGVTRLHVGDAVFGACEGSFAEYACAREDRLAVKPPRLGFEAAAAVPVSGVTALQGLRDKGEVGPGQKLLVIGAGGGVGTFAVQLGRAFGAEVTGVCSTSKVDLVRSIGAGEVIDYTREDFADRGPRYDVILDTAGNRPLSHLRRALAPHGILVIVGGEAGGRWLGGTHRQLLALVESRFVRQRLRPLMAMIRPGDLETLKGLIESGKVTPLIDRTYPLEQASEALRHLERGHVRGKIVLTVSPPSAEVPRPEGPGPQ
jgi:NADPH:quinone reductase-like Zn-dependent oxidoreductase